MQFEWDSSKDAINVQKHGVSFREAVEAFDDPLSFFIKDERHSADEVRRFLVGKMRDGRVITVRFTLRCNDTVRIIGAGEWRIFRRIYNEKTKHKKS